MAQSRDHKTLTVMPEFDLIRRIQDIIYLPDAVGRPDCVLGIGDDAAVLDVPPDRHLVICTDTLVEGVHFPAETDPRAVGHKSLAVNLSDLAAMGADPAWFFLALTLPDGDPDWVEAFARGMAGLAGETGIVLAGGDTTSGNRSITITAVGLVGKDGVLTRGGANPGDRVLVSGTPGRAALALRQMNAGAVPSTEDRKALDYPSPRLQLGAALRGLATACIDISDGLSADLGHILEQSGVGAEIDLADLPCSDTLSRLSEEERWAFQLGGGDDYELCFTVPPDRVGEVGTIAADCGVELTGIGTIRGKSGLVLNHPDGGRFESGSAGYQHFAGSQAESA